ncbi:hypothetical protein [Kaarinaea lacus]
MNIQQLFTGAVAIVVGCLVNYVGDLLLGVRIELFWGLDTFSFIWFLQLFILPVLVGMSVSFIYGLGGKWLSYFPPLIIRLAAYYETQYIIGVPDGASLMPMGWWGFFVIIAIECAVIGGVFGEIMIKRIYGRTAPEDAQRNLLHPNKDDEASDKEPH